MRTITCKNKDGISLSFGEEGFTPFVLVDCDGAYEVKSDISLFENRIIDGSIYLGQVISKRNIVLTLRDKEDHVANRNLLLQLFKPKEKGVLIFEEDESKRQCEYYVEALNSSGKNYSRTYTVSLICDDPFFYAIDDVVVQMSAYISSFKFPHYFLASKEELGYRSLSKSQNILNQNAYDDIGMNIVIEATGEVKNPSIIHVEKEQKTEVGTNKKPFILNAGDKLMITTSTGNKHVYLLHDDKKREINEYLSEDSSFIQLKRGNNNIGYSASLGVNNMIVTITYRYKFASA